MKRAIAAVVAIVSIAWMAFHAVIFVSLVQSEVIPALTAGSLSIRTNSMILGRVWEGNELYWLLTAHAVLVSVLAVVATLAARFAIRGRGQPRAAA